MTRKQLEELGLNKEHIDSIMEQNGKDIEVLKTKVETLLSDNKSLTDKIQISTQKADVGDNEQFNALKQELTKAQRELESQSQAHQSELKSFKIRALAEKGLINKVDYPELIVNMLDESKINFDETGNTTGLNEQIESIKQNYSTLFKQESKGTKLSGFKPAESSDLADESSSSIAATFSNALMGN